MSLGGAVMSEAADSLCAPWALCSRLILYSMVFLKCSSIFILQGKRPRRKGSRRWGCWERLGDTQSTAKCLPAWRGACWGHLSPTGG